MYNVGDRDLGSHVSLYASSQEYPAFHLYE